MRIIEDLKWGASLALDAPSLSRGELKLLAVLWFPKLLLTHPQLSLNYLNLGLERTNLSQSFSIGGEVFLFGEGHSD